MAEYFLFVKVLSVVELFYSHGQSKLKRGGLFYILCLVCNCLYGMNCVFCQGLCWWCIAMGL